MTVSSLRAFLKKHGFSNYELRRKDVNDMRKDVYNVQLNIVKRLDRASAEALIDSGEIHLPEGFDNRARFFSPLFPVIQSYRICHWKYDSAHSCYMVKRMTGATHVFYLTFEVARLPADDLYELAAIPLYNPSQDQKARDFASFLHNQRRIDFAAVNFDNPDSIRNKALQFEGVQPLDTREFLYDMFLCMRYDQVPRKSHINLLDNLKKWFLDGRSFEFVFEKEDGEEIRIYHPQELNMFTRSDLVKISKTRGSEIRSWNARMYEFTEDIVKKLIECIPSDEELEKMRKRQEDQKKAVSQRKISSEEPFSGGVRIED